MLLISEISSYLEVEAGYSVFNPLSGLDLRVNYDHPIIMAHLRYYSSSCLMALINGSTHQVSAVLLFDTIYHYAEQ